MYELFNNMMIEVDKRAQNVVELLKENSMTISTAESCTGGMLSAAITRVAGASGVFNLGLCTYSNEAKEQYLGVKKETLAKHGAVSEETALEMAKGAVTSGQADLGISTTGIAGPGGGTPQKPVGTVYIASVCGETELYKLLSIDPGGVEPEIQREYVRYQTVIKALELAYEVVSLRNKNKLS